ncbi:hypothetical protein K1T71_000405 [Dendrolimus kikuchii]|uniref:Uncharacterized protein n=1 Tax=Dendrolimus kikuchii TaxID=765133 RepID=A0ACC1DKK6_9NEOP|nr:hypothetical protein K1T71_000405 [Dendrolimus kikuchii]
MEAGYTKADSVNLPNIDVVIVASFFASNSNFNAAEFRNVKTCVNSKMCTLKCKVCPKHRVQSKSYAATMVVDEKESKVVSVQYHDCAASQGGCKHAVALLMWFHRRSEEPSCTSFS